MFDPDAIDVVLCDLDGVVWLAHEPLPGSVEAVATIRASGRRVLFVTNNSVSPIGHHEAALASVGIPATGDVVSSAQAGARLVDAGERVLVGGGPGVVEAVRARGAEPLDPARPLRGRVDAVIVGLHRDFDYPRLAALTAAVHGGARLIATNDDATYPTPRGPEPGGGAIVAAVATAAGTAPIVAGKPHRPMAELVLERCGAGLEARRALMVGDRWSTDGAFAVTLGCWYAQVRTGVLAPGVAPEGPAALDVADLAAVAAALGAIGRR